MITSLCILARVTGLDDDEEMVVRAMLKADPAAVRGNEATLAWTSLLENVEWTDACGLMPRERMLTALGRLVHRTAGKGAIAGSRRMPVFALLQHQPARSSTRCQLDPLFVSALNGVAARCAIAAF